MNVPEPQGHFTDIDHDHSVCLSNALTQAEHVCATQGKRLTPMRRRVLELIWADHSPVKAYDLLDRLQAKQGKVAPPTVYRALEFLQEAGLIHRLESHNAFVGCPYPGHGDKVRFLICRACGAIAEQAMGELSKRIAADAEEVGFQVEDQLLEVTGLCPQCQKQS